MHKGSFLRKLKIVSVGSAMADLAMLLLVFFMATTTTEPPKGVDVELPQAETQGAEQDSLYITISINGELYFDGKKVTIEELQDSLAMRQSEKDRIMSITADKNLNYETIAEVLKILQQQEFFNVVFMSQPRAKVSRINE